MTIINLMDDERLLVKFFRGATWRARRVFLAVVFNSRDRIDEAGMAIYRAATGRTRLPDGPVKRVFVAVGRRGGKSILFLRLFALSCAG